MKIIQLIVIICLLCGQSFAQSSDLVLSESKLNGHWKLVDTKIVEEVTFLALPKAKVPKLNRVSEDSPWDSYQKVDLVFDKDSIYRVQYPIRMIAAGQFFLDSTHLHISSDGESSKCPQQFQNDTLYLYRSMTNDNGFFKEAFVRTKFNDSILQVMKNYRINYPELAGTWELVREEDYDYGTYYELKVPFSLPDTIEISRTQMIAALEGEKSFRIMTSGVEREYTFRYYNSYLYFKPGDWYNGEDPMIHFYQKE